MTLRMNWMAVTLILVITILTSGSWVIAMMTILTLRNGLRVSSAIPSGVLAELFVFYALRTNAGKAFVSSSKTETNDNGSLKKLRVANIVSSKFPSFNF